MKTKLNVAQIGVGYWGPNLVRNLVNNDRCDFMDFDNVNTFSYDYRSGNIKIPDIKWIEPLKAEIDHFFDCILDGQKCLTDAKHAKKVI